MDLHHLIQVIHCRWEMEKRMKMSHSGETEVIVPHVPSLTFLSWSDYEYLTYVSFVFLKLNNKAHENKWIDR